MELASSGARRVSVEELNTTRLLAHASQQARQRKFADILIVDVDSHHYEAEHMGEIVEYFEDPVLKQLARSFNQTTRLGRGLMVGRIGYQDMGGRIARYAMRRTEKTPEGAERDAVLGLRWMDAMGVDYACLFPTGMLSIGLHPQTEVEVAMCRAYNRWLTEKVLPESDRITSMLSLPFSDPDATYRTILDFADKPGVVGFMVTSVRYKPVHDNAYMKCYRAIEERGLALAFHAGPNWGDRMLEQCNRFIAVHALGFTFYNILHLTNWVINGLPERFPDLKVIWTESGLAWLPFLMQRLDHEYMMRSSECPLLKKRPSDYMRGMYYSSQPMEVPEDLGVLETTFKMIGAESQLLYSSDYPHWDFDLPSKIYDLPFLSETAKHNILGGNAARLFGLKPRTRKQEKNFEKHCQAGSEAAG